MCKIIATQPICILGLLTNTDPNTDENTDTNADKSIHSSFSRRDRVAHGQCSCDPHLSDCVATALHKADHSHRKPISHSFLQTNVNIGLIIGLTVFDQIPWVMLDLAFFSFLIGCLWAAIVWPTRNLQVQWNDSCWSGEGEGADARRVKRSQPSWAGWPDFFTFLHCVFLDVSSYCLPQRTHIHIEMKMKWQLLEGGGADTGRVKWSQPSWVWWSPAS